MEINRKLELNLPTVPQNCKNKLRLLRKHKQRVTLCIRFETCFMNSEHLINKYSMKADLH